MGIKVGIDLGTTFCAVARINPATGKPEIVKTADGSNVTPSVLYFYPTGQILFGEDAKSMQSMGSTDTAAFFKRRMGEEGFSLEFSEKTYTPTDLSALLLKSIVAEAEKVCGETIDSAVITVPAYFGHKEREATMEAGKKAGLNVLQIINEPSAAAFAYGLTDRAEEQTVMIYDLGGGTFDVTVARINRQTIEVLGTAGNHELGGKDWDDCLARYLAFSFKEQTGLDMSGDEEAVASLLVTAESVKKQLSSRDEVKASVTYHGTRADIFVTETLFEEITEYLLVETKTLTAELLEELHMTWKDLTGVILVGGSTRMKMVRRYVTELSGKEPIGGVDPDEAVALGAAIRANIDENGKAVMATLSGKSAPMCLLGGKTITDVTAHALGMIAENEDRSRYVNSTIIPRNKAIPAEEKRVFSFRTHSGNNEMEVYVLQGSHERPLDNNILYCYLISGIEHTGRTPAQVEVSYRYTVNGIVEVSAMQLGVNKSLTVRKEQVPEDMSWTDECPKDRDDGFGCDIPNVDIYLAVDLSGSMSGIPLDKAKAAMVKFLTELRQDNIRMGLISFADKVRVDCKLTPDFDEVEAAIKQLRIQGTSDGGVGYGNAAEPFSEAKSRFAGSDAEMRYLVVLTDGVWSYQDRAKERAKELRKSGAEVMALGFGTADESFLRAVASVDDFAGLTDLSGLEGSFSRIAKVIGSGMTSL